MQAGVGVLQAPVLAHLRTKHVNTVRLCCVKDITAMTIIHTPRGQLSVYAAKSAPA